MTEERSQKHTPSPALWVLLAGGLIVGILMAILTVSWGKPNTTPSAGSSGLISIAEPAVIGQPAPTFSADTPNGQAIDLEELRGSPVALNFWATWCAPCRLEMPELQRTAVRYADQGLVILGVNAGEPADQVNAYMDELKLTFPTVIDANGSIANQYGVYALPTTIWIDADGIIRARHLGPLEKEDIDRYMAELLGE